MPSPLVCVNVSRHAQNSINKQHQLLLSTPWTQPAVSCAAPGHLMVHDCPDARMLEDPIQEIYVPVRLC
jgi:hypothetical protein